MLQDKKPFSFRQSYPHFFLCWSLAPTWASLEILGFQRRFYFLFKKCNVIFTTVFLYRPTEYTGRGIVSILKIFIVSRSNEALKMEVGKIIIYFYYLFFTVVHSQVVFHSCRPFVANAKFSTGLVGVEVTSVFITWNENNRRNYVHNTPRKQP